MNHDDFLQSDFMKGYTRDAITANRLVNAVRACVYAYPTMRLGQIIDNALCVNDVAAQYDGPNLFNVHDETLVEALEAYATTPPPIN